MPLTYSRVFRVRHYECDSYGHVNAVNYLRYMQEAAFDATAAAGYDMARYDAMNRMWLVRETDIEYLTPLIYGQSVEVKTWVVDFRRVRSIRAYELRNAETGALAARATTDWAYLDKATFRPAQIPPELIAAFYPEGMPDIAPPRQKFPEPPPLPPRVFATRRRVEWRDCDPAQHVNNSVYLNYTEECGLELAAAGGWPAARFSETNTGIFARSHRIEYKQQAVMDDKLEITTWAYGRRRASISRHYFIHRVSDGALMAQVLSQYVWVDTRSGKPITVPDNFLADFADNIAA